MAQLTDDHLLLRCAKDPVFFAEMVLPAAPSRNFYEGAPLILKWWQKEGIEKFRDNKRCTIRIRRQTGKTIVAIVYALWAIAFTERHIEILVVAPHQSQVNTWWERFFHFIDHCPFLKSMVVERRKQPNMYVKFENGCFINMICAGSEGESIRSKSADILFLDEADFLPKLAEEAVMGLVKPHTQVIATTTIRGNKTMFYHWCNGDSDWCNIHVDTETDPDWTKEEEDQVRKTGISRQAFDREYRCIWSDADLSVFPRRYLELATSYGEWSYETYLQPMHCWPTYGPTFLSVDWDKYGAGCTLTCLQYDQTEGSPTFNKFRVIYREEIPRTEYTLSRAVDRTIELNAHFNPVRINCDRGYGEHQVEVLKEHGIKFPYTKLHERINGIAAQESIEIIDPITGEGRKKPIKAYMVARTQYFFEQGEIAISPIDNVMLDQLGAYEVVNAEKEIYTNKNDHCVDGLNLAILAWCQTLGTFSAETSPSPVFIGRTPTVTNTIPDEVAFASAVRTGMRSTRGSEWISRGQMPSGSRQSQGRPSYLRRF